MTQGTGTYFPHRDADWLTTYGGQTEKIELGPDCTDERQQQIFLPLRRLQNGICYVIFLEKQNFSNGNGDYGNRKTAMEWWKLGVSHTPAYTTRP